MKLAKRRRKIYVACASSNVSILANLGLNGYTRTITAFGRKADIRVRFELSSHVKFQTDPLSPLWP